MDDRKFRAIVHRSSFMRDAISRSHAPRGNALFDALRRLRPGPGRSPEDAERPGPHSHAERGNEFKIGGGVQQGVSFFSSSSLLCIFLANLASWRFNGLCLRDDVPIIGALGPS